MPMHPRPMDETVRGETIPRVLVCCVVFCSGMLPANLLERTLSQGEADRVHGWTRALGVVQSFLDDDDRRLPLRVTRALARTLGGGPVHKDWRHARRVAVGLAAPGLALI